MPVFRDAQINLFFFVKEIKYPHSTGLIGLF